jgi:hypothetical protein
MAICEPTLILVGASSWPNIREEKQHQQSATARGHVHAPSRKIVLLVWIAIVTGKTEIDVPAGIASVATNRSPTRASPMIQIWVVSDRERC